jgi:dTDP-4-amino-4,6-dideoxygalactose transaminase
LLRNQGMERQYENELAGYNLRMTDLAAAIGREQLRRLESFTATRRSNAAVLTEGLADRVTTPVEADGAVHVYHQYTVRSGERDELAARLERRGVQARVYYPTPVHRLPTFARSIELKETERAASEVLSLPVGPHLTERDLEAIIEAATA